MNNGGRVVTLCRMKWSKKLRLLLCCIFFLLVTPKSYRCRSSFCSSCMLILPTRMSNTVRKSKVSGAFHTVLMIPTTKRIVLVNTTRRLSSCLSKLWCSCLPMWLSSDIISDPNHISQRLLAGQTWLVTCIFQILLHHARLSLFVPHFFCSVVNFMVGNLLLRFLQLILTPTSISFLRLTK